MNEKDITISAVVIAWNGMKFLPDCLRTLTEDLKDLDHEIIVIDNGSEDGSPEFVADYYPDIKLIANESNRGFAHAVNQGFLEGEGEYYYILNQDLRFKQGTAKKLLERISQDESIGFIGPKFIYFDGPTQNSVRQFPTYKHVMYRALLLDRLFPKHPEFAGYRMKHFDHETEAFVDQPMGAVMMIPRRVVDDIGLMDENFPILFNDVDYCRRIHEAGYKCLYYPEAVVEHYVGASTSTMPVKIRYISHTSMFRYLKKYATPREYPALLLTGAVLMMTLPLAIVVNVVRRRLSAIRSSS